MKKVIFICLLSLSMCLSAPGEIKDPANQVQTQNAHATPDPKPQNTPEVTGNISSPVDQNNTTTAQNKTTTINSPSIDTQKTPEQNNTTNKSPSQTTLNVDTTTINNKPSEKDTKQPPKIDNTSDAKPQITNTTGPNDTTKPDDNTAKKNETANETNKPNEPSKPTESTKPTEPTKPAETPKTTVAPKPDTDKNNANVQARGFDGPSFMGGIILTLGLLAIGFMGLKYYKNRTERNYHTL